MTQGHTVRIDTPDKIDERLRYLGLRLLEIGKFPTLIQIKKDTRSEQMNRFLWGWLYRELARQLEEGGIVILSDDGQEFPYTAELLHEIFKEQFLTRAEIKRGEKTRKLTWSTTELLRRESDEEPGKAPSFRWYVAQVRQFAAQFWNVHIGDPPLRAQDYPELMAELRGET